MQEKIKIFEIQKMILVKGIGRSFFIILMASLAILFFENEIIKEMELINYFIYCGFVFLFFALFETSIFYQYFRYNKGWRITWFENHQRLKIETGLNIFSLSKDDIKRIDRVCSFSFAERRMYWFPSDSYNYTILNLHTGQKIIITSLLVPRFEFFQKNEKINLKKKFFAFIAAGTPPAEE